MTKHFRISGGSNPSGCVFFFSCFRLDFGLPSTRCSGDHLTHQETSRCHCPFNLLYILVIILLLVWAPIMLLSCKNHRFAWSYPVRFRVKCFLSTRVLGTKDGISREWLSSFDSLAKIIPTAVAQSTTEVFFNASGVVEGANEAHFKG